MCPFHWAGSCWMYVDVIFSHWACILPSHEQHLSFCWTSGITPCVPVLSCHLSSVHICSIWPNEIFLFFSSFKMRIKWLKGYNTHVSLFIVHSALALCSFSVILDLFSSCWHSILQNNAMDGVHFPALPSAFIVPRLQPLSKLIFFVGNNWQMFSSITLPTSLPKPADLSLHL